MNSILKFNTINIRAPINLVLFRYIVPVDDVAGFTNFTRNSNKPNA